MFVFGQNQPYLFDSRLTKDLLDSVKHWTKSNKTDYCNRSLNRSAEDSRSASVDLKLKSGTKICKQVVLMLVVWWEAQSLVKILYASVLVETVKVVEMEFLWMVVVAAVLTAETAVWVAVVAVAAGYFFQCWGPRWQVAFSPSVVPDSWWASTGVVKQEDNRLKG
ncbi:hypothetical protein E2C01_020997 [Portunus trituberculatus]|uniref:Uncharacterized protein n=1 Tax=Portunus trituberculatus TaxID=210409 RepID=A0A5B7E3I1_PORTR|nr:hypothetical protein [Portunus trituberculatus]